MLDGLLRRLITEGSLAVRWPTGDIARYQGEQPGPHASMAVTSTRAIRRLIFNPGLALGEEYMDGNVQPVDCTIHDVLDVLSVNLSRNWNSHRVMSLRYRIATFLRRFDQYNPARRAQRNVSHHYDLNGRLYSLFLDHDRQYSCAYFQTGDETLEEAQAAKVRHIAAKLCLDRPDLTVLDIGSGWGGLGLALARDHGARVLGITLSTEQLAESRARAAAEGLQDRVRFELLDYRAVQGKFDRIVSVGMFEHVGIGYYRTFFDTVARRLNPDGVALIHAIGRFDGPSSTNPWVRKYIFPGGYCPSLSEVLPAVEQSRLISTDIEILRLHYAQTLRAWRRRFAAKRDAIATLYDERFCRMFEFYLAGSEMAFRHMNHMVFQIQLAHQQTAVPLTRDYIAEAEQAPGALTAAARESVAAAR
jgi:cyclopropane-fatty-acyl-phospholipid synthase